MFKPVKIPTELRIIMDTEPQEWKMVSISSVNRDVSHNVGSFIKSTGYNSNIFKVVVWEERKKEGRCEYISI